MKNNSLQYGLDDYNLHVVLRVPVLLGLVFVYLNKYMVLFVLPQIPRVGKNLDFLRQVDFIQLDPGLLLAGIPALAVTIVALARRAPNAGQWPRRIWRRGRPLLMLSSLAEFGLLISYALAGRREFDVVLIAFAYLDLMIVFYLFMSQRAVDVFADFPDAPGTKGGSPPDRARRRRRTEAAKRSAPTQAKIALVHLGGDVNMTLKREAIVGLHSSFAALGYDSVIRQNYLDIKRLNIIVGFDMAQPETRLQLREKKMDYVVYETEVMQDRESKNDPGAAIDFQNDYLPALGAAKLVMSPFKYVVNNLDSLGINAAYTRWGYVPELDDVPARPDELKDFDCYFFGQLTPGRRDVLQAMVDRGLKVKATGDPGVPAFLINHFLSRSKIVLGLRRDGRQQTVAPFRTMHALQNGCCVVTERQEIDLDAYNTYGCETEIESLAQYCLNIIRSGEYREACADKRERLLAEPTVKKNLQGLI